MFFFPNFVTYQLNAIVQSVDYESFSHEFESNWGFMIFTFPNFWNIIFDKYCKTANSTPQSILII